MGGKKHGEKSCGGELGLLKLQFPICSKAEFTTWSEPRCVLRAVLADNALQALAAYSRRSTRLADTVNSCITVPISISEEIMKRL